ncbi:MAG: glucosaminidase [Pelagibacteraceae bacterium TMED246]|nr:MAG: glucosaminidase [Pelagibacteraceae bacterium TMED246]|tara:strand:- start:2375 stop:3508 length:1134 start_codon:yes stop_codon:yes gene_type:complete
MNFKKKIFPPNYINFSNKKIFSTIRKVRKDFNLSDPKKLSYTFLTSLSLILIFFMLPLAVKFNKDINLNKVEITNKSKTKFEKVLDGEVLDKSVKLDQGLDLKNLYEDVFKTDELPTDTVRLNASTIEELFKETDYNLEDVRETKLVKPIRLSLLPEEMRKIENTKKRKTLFIQIVLPLIIEENTKVKLDRIRLFNILNKSNNTQSEKNWINSKFKQYGVVNKDLSTLKIRMDIVPTSIAIAQAAKETGWGTSRFALEGNALFGQWTWSGEGIKPSGAKSDTTHKVMRFKILKSSVKAYIRNLNTHSSYRSFRMARAELRDKKKGLDSLILTNYLDKYAETGIEYVKILKQIIKQNRLTDFDDAKLLPSSLQLKSLI